MILCQKNGSDEVEGIEWNKRTNDHWRDGINWDHIKSKLSSFSMEFNSSSKVNDWREEAYNHANSSLDRNSSSKFKKIYLFVKYHSESEVLFIASYSQCTQNLHDL